MLLSCLFAIPFCEYTASNGQQTRLVLKFKKKNDSDMAKKRGIIKHILFHCMAF